MKYLRPLLNPGIYVGVVVAAALVVASYQARPSYDVTFGTSNDAPLLRGFNTAEVMAGANPIPFRWSTGDAHIILQDVGQQDFDVALTIAGARPVGQPPADLTVSVGSLTLLHLSPKAELTGYSFSVPRTALRDGTLDLHLATNAFIPPGDPNPRPLGVVVTRLQVTPSANSDRFIEPPVDLLFAVTGCAALLALLLALLGWGAAGVAVGGGLVGALAGWIAVADRLWLTTGQWYLAWPQALIAGSVIMLLVWALGGWLLRVSGAPWTAWQRRLLLAMLLLAFAIRLAGQLNPQIVIVDLNFHIHRLETVQAGQLLFTIKSAEWGGRSTFYLPTAYLLMLPLQWLFGDMALDVKLVTVTLGTLGAFPIFYIARKALDDGRAGLVAAALYLTFPIAVLPYSWGITTNIFGEFFALCALAVAVGAYDRLRPNRPAFYLLLASLLLALLSHPGVVQLAGVAFGCISLLWLLGRSTIADKKPALWTLGALALAAGLAYFLYYSHFASEMLSTLGQIRADRGAQNQGGGVNLKVGGSVGDASLGLVVRTVTNWRDWFSGGLRGFWQEAQAYYHVWPVAGAALGYILIWPVKGKSLSARRRRKGRLALAAVGWTLAVLLFALVGWIVNLYVRYALFALPIVALGTGILLSSLWRRGRSGAWLSTIIVAYFVAEALALWQYRINYAFK
ncbi:MAG: hypothetical protein IVW55_02290 [Chloroflexi bacterium]|nr:hypothetical protein [Chloroflexota bacterium]